MSLIVTHKGQVLHGVQGVKARAAAEAFFSAAGVTPLEAATASWQLEGALEHDQSYEVSDEMCRRADLWAEVVEVVASATGCASDDLDVELLPDR